MRVLLVAALHLSLILSTTTAFAVRPAPVSRRVQGVTRLQAHTKSLQTSQTEASAHMRHRATQQPKMSALVLPAAYTSLAVTLALRATQATTRGHVAILASISALALVDLGPTAAAQLASSKTAKKTSMSAAAQSWHALVRFKIVGQVLSLFWMASTARQARTLGGAAVLFATNVCFWLRGAASCRHDGSGVLSPIPDQVFRPILVIDGVLCILALAAALSPTASRRMSLLSKFCSMGILLAVFENVPGFVASLPVALGLKPPPPPPPPAAAPS